jgi:elongation factor P--(R)-beta-lysine ligase
MASTSLESKAILLDTLKARAKMLSVVRSFFARKNSLEVDTPILSRSAPIDTHIDVMTLHFSNGEKGYLHTSPEYAIKRLLAHYPIGVYQLSHVFREGESSQTHNPEFTMIEWYKMGVSLRELIDETIELIQLFIGPQSVTFFTYRDLFLHHAGIDPFQTTPSELCQKALALNLSLPASVSTWDVDTWLHFYMCFFLEPRLTGLTVLYAFPASQAALARLQHDGTNLIAERFEILYNSLELANGFHELTDPIEQRSRFEKANLERQSQGKPALPIDEHFLKALEQGLPDCCGVAAGFDRLLMLQQKTSSIQDVFPFTWDRI